MDRVNRILQHPRFDEELRRLADIEQGRPFCGHGIDHLLDVARIAYILSLETQETSEQQDKELIYAAALLHDIGRSKQYTDGTPHEIESAVIAAEILTECGFNEFEADVILKAILAHRTRNTDKRIGLAGLLYRADKLSRKCFDSADEQPRKCFACGFVADCDWEIKTSVLEY